MKLFYSPGACSLAVHIALEESGLAYETLKVDLKGGESKQALLAVNPKGLVPTLVTDEGRPLTEAAVLLQYVSDHAQARRLLPALGTWERYKALEWLNYVATELHKGFGAIFHPENFAQDPEVQKEVKLSAQRALEKKFRFVGESLGSGPYLIGDFCLADAYLFTILRWARAKKIELPENLNAYFLSFAERPATQRTLQKEGITAR